LVLLMGEIYKCAAKMSSGALICIPSFIKTGRAIQAIFRVCLSNLKCCDAGITVGGIYEVCHLDGLMWHDTYI
jgi:hypothetical protein